MPVPVFHDAAARVMRVPAAATLAEFVSRFHPRNNVRAYGAEG
ncbi:hypothetical protein [Tanticharoenia sakaeratensis]|jgi:hypothetical protein|nr:hypothetical protein [Tanticharoenia sakaeratensis]